MSDFQKHPKSLLSEQLLETAQKRLQIEPNISPADLRRSRSDLYYAAFHCICETLVESLVMDPESPEFRETYETLYRLPDHGTVEERCRQARNHGFSRDFQIFGNLVIDLKNKRHKADYKPLEVLERSAVESDIEKAKKALGDFRKLPLLDRIRFAFFVSLRVKRKN